MIGTLVLWLGCLHAQAVRDAKKRFALCFVCALSACLLAAQGAPTMACFLLRYALFLLLALIALIDGARQYIPDVLTLLILPLAACLRDIALMQRLWCAIGIGGSLCLLCVLWKGCLGWGDVKLCTALGAALGLDFLAGLRWSVTAAGVYAGILLGRGRVKPGTRLAFGPWIVLGAALALL